MSDKPSILAVDDTPESLALLVDLLSRKGFEVRAADSGELALAAAAANPPDLILLDVRMKGLDGFAVCRGLKASEATRNIPIILMSAFAEAKEWLEGLRLGAADYVTKPFAPAELISRVSTQLALRAAKASLEGRAIELRTSNDQLAAEIVRRERIEAELREELDRSELSRRALLGVIEDKQRAEAEKDKLREQLNQAQKLDSIGRLAGGVAHDFNNMLGVILGFSELALMQMRPDEPLRKDLEEVQNAAKRSATLTRQLLAFARKQFVSPKVLDLNEAVDGMLKMLRRLIGEDVELAWQPAAELWKVRVDPGQVDQILANLCLNARDAIGAGGASGKLTVATANATFDAGYCASHTECRPGDFVSLVVSDNGCGMDEETQARIFEPFFTTKSVGEGTGLGLATVYGIVKQNEGFIAFESAPGKGTTFRLYLPRVVAETVQPKKAGDDSIVRGTETVLIVDDELTVANAAKAMLERSGYRVLTAETPGEGIRLAKQHAGEIHLLLTDLVMPVMSGWDMAAELSKRYPALKCLFMSGYTGDVIAKHLVQTKGVHFIQKPFTRVELTAKVREVLRGD